MIATCLECKRDFKTFPAWVRKGGGKYCSYGCMGASRKGQTTYTRTPQQNIEMSRLIRSKDLTKQSKIMSAYNSSKKGKTLEEIYGDRAEVIRPKYARLGTENSNWRGGQHRNRYPFTFYKIRLEVLERDRWVCQNCDMTETEAQSKDRFSRGLTVHHIDYDKENNDLGNLITLCKWCNSSANSRRQEWQIFYQSKLVG